MENLDSKALPQNIIDRMNPSDRESLDLKTRPEINAQVYAKRESEFQKLCEADLNRRGIAFLHLSPRAREKKGWPDLTFSFPRGATADGIHPTGVPCAVELKVGQNTLSEDQISTLSQMAANGWAVGVVYDHLDAFRDFLDSVRKGLNLCLPVTDAPPEYRKPCV